MIFLQILLLIACYIVAVNMAVRIYRYSKTGNSAYKHDYRAFIQTGKHERKRG